MGDRVRAAQAAAAEEAKNMAAYNTPANLPPINANMQVPQNQWTYDSQGNPQFVVPGFFNSTPAPNVTPDTSLSEIVGKMRMLDPHRAAMDPKWHQQAQQPTSSLMDMLQSLMGVNKPAAGLAGDPAGEMALKNQRHAAFLDNFQRERNAANQQHNMAMGNIGQPSFQDWFASLGKK